MKRGIGVLLMHCWELFYTDFWGCPTKICSYYWPSFPQLLLLWLRSLTASLAISVLVLMYIAKPISWISLVAAFLPFSLSLLYFLLWSASHSPYHPNCCNAIFLATLLEPPSVLECFLLITWMSSCWQLCLFLSPHLLTFVPWIYPEPTG